MQQYDQFLAFAHKMADAAGDFIRPKFRSDKSELGVDIKDDHSPIVTIVDTMVEETLRTMIMDTFPDHGVIGEEHDDHMPDARYLWVIDPIDGTIAFTMGKATFGTVIALFDEERPIMGLIDQPIMNERWVGVADRRTTLNGKPISTSQTTRLKEACAALNGAEHLCGMESMWGQVSSVLSSSKVHGFGGDCYNFGLLAHGSIDLVIEAEPDLCDFASMIPIVEGAGGIMTGWSGEILNRTYKGGVIATAHADLHAEALDLLRR